MSLLTILSSSDHHFGDPKNSTENMTEAHKYLLTQPGVCDDVDIMFMVGDLFDRRLNLDDPAVTFILIWAVWLLTYCSENNIILRMSKGTPSHEWDQLNIFDALYATGKFHLDFKYYSTLEIEYIPKHDINVLYIPDEWDINTSNTLDQVKQLLKAKGLDKVDIACVHGTYDFQLPEIAHTPKHNSEEYLTLVKYFIFVGHIHTHLVYKNIIGHGSFDRTAHGQEEAKGMIKAYINLETDEKSYTFIENTKARIYKTIKCFGMTLENSIDYIKEHIKDLPADSCVRIMAENNNPIFSNMIELVKLNPLLVWTKENSTKETKEKLLSINATVQNAAGITITKENLSQLLLARISAKTLTKDMVERIESELSEVI